MPRSDRTLPLIGAKALEARKVLLLPLLLLLMLFMRPLPPLLFMAMTDNTPSKRWAATRTAPLCGVCGVLGAGLGQLQLSLLSTKDSLWPLLVVVLLLLLPPAMTDSPAPECMAAACTALCGMLGTSLGQLLRSILNSEKALLLLLPLLVLLLLLWQSLLLAMTDNPAHEPVAAAGVAGNGLGQLLRPMLSTGMRSLCRTSDAGITEGLCAKDCAITLCMALQSTLKALRVLSQHHPSWDGYSGPAVATERDAGAAASPRALGACPRVCNAVTATGLAACLHLKTTAAAPDCTHCTVGPRPACLKPAVSILSART
jgi:hypothetical protein